MALEIAAVSVSVLTSEASDRFNIWKRVRHAEEKVDFSYEIYEVRSILPMANLCTHHFIEPVSYTLLKDYHINL